MPLYAYLLIAGCSFFWILPFLLQERRRDTPQQVDRRARWGMLLLLTSRFGAEFQEYRQTVPAYLPLPTRLHRGT
jgi:hypothetical protein